MPFPATRHSCNPTKAAAKTCAKTYAKTCAKTAIGKIPGGLLAVGVLLAAASVYADKSAATGAAGVSAAMIAADFTRSA